jgi:hypothetical protein
MIWHPEHDLDGRLRYILKQGASFLPLCVITRYDRYNWTLLHADGLVTIKGGLKEVKQKAEGMLGVA